MHVPALLSVSNLVFCRNSLLPFLQQMLLTSPSSRSPFTGLFVHLDEFTHITSVGAQLCLNKPPLMVGICFLHLPATGFCTDWTGSVEFKLLPTIKQLVVISHQLFPSSCEQVTLHHAEGFKGILWPFHRRQTWVHSWASNSCSEQGFILVKGSNQTPLAKTC